MAVKRWTDLMANKYTPEQLLARRKRLEGVIERSPEFWEEIERRRRSTTPRKTIEQIRAELHRANTDTADGNQQ